MYTSTPELRRIGVPTKAFTAAVAALEAKRSSSSMHGDARGARLVEVHRAERANGERVKQLRLEPGERENRVECDEGNIEGKRERESK